jgi:hypothetical protein
MNNDAVSGATEERSELAGEQERRTSARSASGRAASATEETPAAPEATR